MINTKLLLIAVALSAAAGCTSVASTSRSGIIHDVNFEEHMTPANLQVQAGDEVRWVNQRATPVTVEFLEGALDEVVCRQGFSSLTGRPQESTTVEPNESVSLCFSEVGTVTYNARMESAVAGGLVIESGIILIRE